MLNVLEDERLEILNHSCAHLLAHAVKNLYPDAMFWVGPAIEGGFYYDIDLADKSISEEDLVKIEKEMKKIVKEDKLIKRLDLSKEEALELFKGDPYKEDLLSRMEGEISAYQQQDFIDLCKGPHVKSTKELKHFKLLKVSGAYWKGDAENKMLQRIYGICFEDAKSLERHLNFLEEAAKRDHRKLGKEQELFMFSDYGPGFPFWLPKGMTLRKTLEDYWYEEHIKENYQFIQTPTMLNKDLWELSGHWDNFKENMYTSSIDEKTFAIKPMNCPGGMLVYKNSLHSYRELPLRVGELGLVHRHEASGALAGLFRVRSFTQDDAHIFMTKDQIEEEITKLIDFVDRVYKVFGLTYRIELSTRPEEKYIGDIELWNESEAILQKVCEDSGKEFKLNPGDGAFYGPKLDFHITDSLGRSWQCGTIQLDMNLPERFDLYYIDENGEKTRPIMLHRVIFGAIERFIGILIEHFAGVFPLWLAPCQINIIPINNQYHLDYSKQIKSELEAKDFRINLDDRSEKLGYKMRESQIAKTPINIIIGDKELEANSISYRLHGSDKTTTVSKEEFYKLIEDRVNTKAIDI